MAAARYRNFMRLLEGWPKDEDKVCRDLAVYIRERVALAFRAEDAARLRVEECDRQYEALERINSDRYRDMYPRLKVGTCHGIPVESLREGTSTQWFNKMRKHEGEAPLEELDKKMAAKHHADLTKPDQAGSEQKH